MNLYDILGVTKAADTEAIRKAYRQKAKLLHPDAGGDPQKFQQLSLANTVLSDPARRKLYDETGSVDHKSIESERAAILEIIATACNQVLAYPSDPSAFDWVAAVRAAINQSINAGEQAIVRHNANISKFDTITTRLSKKKKSADPALLTILANAKLQHTAALATDTATCARFKQALELLKDYKYEFSVAPQQPFYTFTSGSRFKP